MIQAIICGVMVVMAAVYVGKRWLPHSLKRRGVRRGARVIPIQADSACGACSGCKSGTGC